MTRKFLQIDRPLLWRRSFVGLGLVMVFSASANMSEERFAQPIFLSVSSFSGTAWARRLIPMHAGGLIIDGRRRPGCF